MQAGSFLLTRRHARERPDHRPFGGRKPPAVEPALDAPGFSVCARFGVLDRWGYPTDLGEQEARTPRSERFPAARPLAREAGRSVTRRDLGRLPGAANR